MEKNTEKKRGITGTAQVAFLAMICCVLWGSAFPCVKIGYDLFRIGASDTASQIVFAGTRFFLAGVLALILGSLSQKRVLIPRKKDLPKIGVLAMFQTILQYLFFYIGLAHTTGVKSSIIEAANVFIAILIASLIFHQEKLTRRKMIGCVIGFAGVVLINLSGGGMDMSFQWNGELFILFSTIAYAMSSVFIKKYSAESDPVLLSGWQFCFGGLSPDGTSIPAEKMRRSLPALFPRSSLLLFRLPPLFRSPPRRTPPPAEPLSRRLDDTVSTCLRSALPGRLSPGGSVSLWSHVL